MDPKTLIVKAIEGKSSRAGIIELISFKIIIVEN